MLKSYKIYENSFDSSDYTYITLTEDDEATLEINVNKKTGTISLGDETARDRIYLHNYHLDLLIEMLNLAKVRAGV